MLNAGPIILVEVREGGVFGSLRNGLFSLAPVKIRLFSIAPFCGQRKSGGIFGINTPSAVINYSG